MDPGELRTWLTTLSTGVNEAKGAAMSARSEIRNHDTKVAGIAERIDEQQERMLEAFTSLTNTINRAVQAMEGANKNKSIMSIVDAALKVAMLALIILALGVFGIKASDLKGP